MSRSARKGEMKRRGDDQPGIDEQLRHLADAADVLDAVGVGEAEILVEALADVVAIERVGMRAHGGELALDQVGDGGLARAGQAGEPQDGRLVALEQRAAGLGHVHRVAMDVGGADQRELDHARADRLVGEAVDQDEGAAPRGWRGRDRRRSAGSWRCCRSRSR